MKALEIYAKKIKNPHKPSSAKCGDSFAMSMDSESGLVMLAVSDGVSGTPCDWRASEVACETVLNAFEKSPHVEKIPEFVALAHNAVRSDSTPGCRGMLSSLSLAIVDPTKGAFFYTNVGDSLIMKGPERNLVQITTDDTTYISIKKDGGALMQSGVPVFARGVTRCLGQEDDLDVTVFEDSLNRTDLLILASDGVSKDPAFSVRLGDILAAGHWESHLDDFLAECAHENRDDATLIILRASLDEESSATEFLKLFRDGHPLAESSLTGRDARHSAQRMMKDLLAADANTQVFEVLDYCESNGLSFDKVFLEEFNSLVFAQGTDKKLLERIRELLRSAHVG
jgi:serine/threonine protein phosphatase PrpC